MFSQTSLEKREKMTITQSRIHILVCPENSMRGIYGYSDILVLKIGEGTNLVESHQPLRSLEKGLPQPLERKSRKSHFFLARDEKDFRGQTTDFFVCRFPMPVILRQHDVFTLFLDKIGNSKIL